MSGLLRRLRGDDRQRGFAEAGVAVTGAALVLGAALGSGVASTVVSMSDGVTWLPDGETGQIVQVNPATGRAERRLQVAGPGSELELSQRDGVLVVGDATTGTVTSIDLATLLAGGQRRADEPARVLVGGGKVFLATVSTGVVRAVDALTLADLGTPYRSKDGLADVAVDEQGTVWVAEAGGALRALTWRGASFDVGEPRPVRGAGAATRLLPHGKGVTVFAADGGAVLQIGVGRDLAVAVPDLSGEVLPAVTAPVELAPASVPGRSAVVMLSGDRVLDVGVGALGCERPGNPAVFAGRVYVPCLGAGRVIVLRPDGSRGGPDVIVPGGRDPRVLVDDGRLVVYTEQGARAVLVEADGSTRQLDTGRGDAPVQDPRSGDPGPAVVMPQRPTTQQRPPQRQEPPQHGPQPGDPPVAPPGGDTPPAGGDGGPDVDAPPAATQGPTADPTSGSTPDPTATAGTGTPGPTATSTPTPTSTPRPTTTPSPTPSPTTTPTPTTAPVPRPPTGVQAELGTQHPDGTSDVTVSWAPRPAAQRPDGFVVRASVAGLAPVEVAGDRTSATVRGVTCEARVSFTVDAVIDEATAASAASAPVRTPDCPPTAPAAPTGVSATAHGDGSVTVGWRASTSTVDEYLVGPEGGSTTSVAATATSVVLRDVAPGGGVRFVVQAVRGGMATPSAASNPVTVAGAPGAAGGVQAAFDGRSGDTVNVTASWGAAPDNGSAVTGYAVHWSGGGAAGSTSVAGTSAALAVACGGQALCASGGTLTVTVVPHNGVGEGPAASTTVGVPAPPPPPPAQGDVVVGWIEAGTPGQWDLYIPMYAHLNPPASWASHTGGCEIVIDGASSPIACDTQGRRGIGSYTGPGTVSVAMRALGVNGGSVMSATSTGEIPPRNTWGYCDPNTRICTQPVSVDQDPDVVVVPLPWTPVPGVPGGPDRPPLLAAGLGLLLAAGALRAQRLRPAAAPDTTTTTEETSA